MSEIEDKLEIIRKSVASYPDFPKPGILFRDVFSILKEPQKFKILHELLLGYIAKMRPKVQAIAALEARGFLFGPMLALELEIPFIPIRKKGKLPGETQAVTYDLEYGKDTFEIQLNSAKPGTKVVIIDDLLATGGSLTAACKLLIDAGLEVLQCLVIIELKELKGRDKLGHSLHSFIQY